MQHKYHIFICAKDTIVPKTRDYTKSIPGKAKPYVDGARMLTVEETSRIDRNAKSGSLFLYGDEDLIEVLKSWQGRGVVALHFYNSAGLTSNLAFSKLVTLTSIRSEHHSFQFHCIYVDYLEKVKATANPLYAARG